MCHPFLLNQIVNLLSQIIRFQVNAPFEDFLIVITNFLRALSQKEDDFSWIINQVLRIFWFQALWKPRFENKRNFWLNCVCTKAFRVMIYLQGGICIHCIPTRGHLHHGIVPSGHSHHDIPTWTFTSWHTYMNIYIMTYLHEHLHHGIPTWTFASWHTH